jgi:putative drug exporter of the RND superfamily
MQIRTRHIGSSGQRLSGHAVPRDESLLSSVAGWCVRHRRLVVAAWLVALIGLTTMSHSLGSSYKDSLSLPGTQSFEAQSLLQKAVPQASGDREQIVVAVTTGKVTDPAVHRQVGAMLARVAALGDVASVASPYGPSGAAQISRSGQVAFANVTLTEQAAKITATEAQRLVRMAQTGEGNGIQVGVEGQAAETASRGSAGSTGLGAAAALVVLLLVFGSLLAASLPLLTAGIALGSSSAVIALASHLLNIASFSSELSLLIGLGVGIDYALFIVTRYRQALQRGAPVEESITDAINTSGRAVLFAGSTVCIALLGMFALGVSFIYGVAVAASTAVLFTVVAALTLLPALLGFFGTRVLGRSARRQLQMGAVTHSDESPGWGRWARTIRERPMLTAVAAAVAMLTIALPFFSMRLGSADAGSDPAGSTTRQAYDLLAKGFGPGYNGPLQLVANVDDPTQQAAFTKVTAAVAHTRGVAGVSKPTIIAAASGKAGVETADVYPSGSPQSRSTTDLLHRLRNTVVPGSSTSGLHVLIGGQSAIFDDFASVLSSKLPLFVGAVVLLSFLLLTVVFRSLLIPAVSALMNLLTAGAAFGLTTAVFQWGWAGGVFGVGKTGPIETFVPVLMFAIVFGLSMDYQVFLVTRIYEEWQRRGNNSQAVIHGLAATGKTITAAATIMVLVFASFMLGGQRVIELFGLGLAGAVLLDALVVRSVLVPALMLVAGDANWWLPRRLDRILPRFNVEGGVDDHDIGSEPVVSPVPAHAA